MFLKWVEKREKDKMMDDLSAFIDNLINERDSLVDCRQGKKAQQR